MIILVSSRKVGKENSLLQLLSSPNCSQRMLAISTGFLYGCMSLRQTECSHQVGLNLKSEVFIERNELPGPMIMSEIEFNILLRIVGRIHAN